MASMALILLRQSRRIRSLISERPVGDSSRKREAILPVNDPNWRTDSAPGRSVQPGIFWSLGEPISSKMIWAW
jgi:hypothetical protein